MKSCELERITIGIRNKDGIGNAGIFSFDDLNALSFEFVYRLKKLIAIH